MRHDGLSLVPRELRPWGRFRYPTRCRKAFSFIGLDTKIAAMMAATQYRSRMIFDFAKIEIKF